MDKCSLNGKFQWPKIWAVPLVITLAGTLVFATLFQGKLPDKPAETPVAARSLPAKS
jgi:hypothetical protein